LAQLGAIYLDELQQAGSGQSSQAQLLAFMCRLRRYVDVEKPGFSNSHWPDITEITDKIEAAADTRQQLLCREIVDYIQRNLHLPLRLDEIAQRFGLSRFHLNCIFRQVLGTTVMNYVTRQRIEVAKGIVEHNSDSIHDIAQLTGFASTSSFCTVFRKHTGLTPGEYRLEVQRKARKSAK
jgi:AraC-like DNA-binding protein